MFAHVKWFTTEGSSHLDPGLNYTEILIVLGAIAVSLVSLYFIQKKLIALKIPKKLDNYFKPLRPWVGTVVRLTAGLLLLINIWHGFLLAPNVEFTGGWLQQSIISVFALASISLILGLYSRVGAVLMVFGYLLTFFVVEDMVDALDHLEYLGMGVYIFLQGGCRLALDNSLNKKKSIISTYNIYALPALRIFTGTGLAILGMSEKLLNTSTSQEFLGMHDWNFLSSFGVNDHTFIIITGTTELIVGLALILNITPRIMTLLLLLIMSVTAGLLGLNEVYGHLFAVGVVTALWINDTKPKRQS